MTALIAVLLAGAIGGLAAALACADDGTGGAS